MIQGIIFDMDGLLIDSEPQWKEAAVEVFSKVGVPMTLELAKETMGLRPDETVKYWHHKFPWKTPSQKFVYDELISIMAERLKNTDIVRPGAHEIITLFEGLSLPMAIASSSPQKLIHAVMDNLGIMHKMKALHSAEHEEYGKPHPAVYIAAAERLNIDPAFCLAFEDSPNGVLAAKAAKMKCIAVPDEGQKDSPIFGIADVVLRSLLDFKPSMLLTL